MRARSSLPQFLPTLLVAVIFYVVVLVASNSGLITPYWHGVIQMGTITAISALGLNLIYGFNGQFSLGHVGFYAIGAYGAALISKDYVAQWSGGQWGALSWIIAGQLGVISVIMLVNRLHLGSLQARLDEWLAGRVTPREAEPLKAAVIAILVAGTIGVGVALAWVIHVALLPVLEVLLSNLPAAVAQQVVFLIALLNGATMAALVAYLVGLPLLRLSSDYLGIATLGFAIMVYTALQNSDLVIPTMKGARGMVGIPRWTTWTWSFAALALVVVSMRNLIYSSHGRAVVAIREDESAARAMGIDVAQTKALAFAGGAFFAGLAGGLYAHLYGFLHPSTFSVVKGFDPLIVVVFGGLGSMTGTLLASGLFALIIEGLRVILPQGFEDWRFVIYPIFLLVIMLVRQEGLLGRREWGWLRPPSPPKAQGAPGVISPAGASRAEPDGGLQHG